MSTPDPTGAAVTAARRALDASREAVTRTVTARAQELAEAARLEQRAAAGGALGDLAATAKVHAARAADLEPRIEQLRDLARRAEVAFEALRSSAGTGPATDDPDVDDPATPAT
ncbi:MAG: hypothetical protein AB7G37_11735 [Solirubrobacteraceae bacterium]